MKSLTLLAASFLFTASVQAAADLTPASRAEVESLLATLGGSSCEFNRNGEWHGGIEAQAHLRTKLDYLVKRDLVHTTEEFIEGAATRSSLSGKSYRVRCQNQAEQPSAAWLSDRLRERRMVRQDARP